MFKTQFLFLIAISSISSITLYPGSPNFFRILIKTSQNNWLLSLDFTLNSNKILYIFNNSIKAFSLILGLFSPCVTIVCIFSGYLRKLYWLIALKSGARSLLFSAYINSSFKTLALKAVTLVLVGWVSRLPEIVESRLFSSGNWRTSLDVESSFYIIINDYIVNPFVIYIWK